MMNSKPRTTRRQRAVAARHKRAAKAARLRNRGRYDTLTSEQKWGQQKRAFKRQFDALAMPTPFDAVLLKLDAQKPVMQRFLPDWSEWRKRAA